MGLRYCPKVLEHIHTVLDDPYCHECGAETKPMPTCCCGKRFYPWTKFCGQCGKPVQWPKMEEEL